MLSKISRFRKYKGVVLQEKRESMEEALLPENDKETGSTKVATWKIYVEELKRVNGIALPMMVATVGQYLLRVSPIFMLGHLGQLQLSGASIATSFSNVTGFSVLVSPFP